jgi:Putative zinc-finger
MSWVEPSRAGDRSASEGTCGHGDAPHESSDGTVTKLTEHRSACEMFRVSLGVYVLDVMDVEDRSTVDEHLASCPACLAELAELEMLPALLGTIDEDQIADLLNSDRAPSPAAAETLVTEVRAHRARSRRYLALAAVAAVMALIAGPTITVAVMGPRDTPVVTSVPLNAFTKSESATNTRTGTAATVSLLSREWGTKVNLKIRNVPGGRVCELRAVHPDGTHEVVASWRVRPEGYSGSETLTVDGSIATDLSSISGFAVDTNRGERLVTVRA